MKTIIRKTSLFSVLFFCLLPLYSQLLSRKEFVRAVKDADNFYYYEINYSKAAELYESLVDLYPDNSNLTAKLGICFLNLDGKKADALRLLSKASLNVVNTENEYDEYGEKAPLDTWLYLAEAYHQNDSLQKAITLFLDAKKRLQGTKAYKEEYIDKQIGDCRYAIDMNKRPLTMITSVFIPWLGNYPGAINPVLSKNDSVFIFTQKVDGKTHILCSYKSGIWKRPVDITEQLGGFDRFYSNSITGDGKLLILFMDDGDDGNLYYSQRKDSIWAKIKSVGKPVNNIYWQAFGFITPDGNTMYYSSNQPGGEGQLDIWYSKKTGPDKWGEPVNCGDVINTPYNEDTPFYDPDTQALLFSSNGHLSMGGYDIYRSINRNGIWTNPIGMPYNFNNTADNTFFILNNNAPGFITSLYNEKDKSRNIYTIVAENPADKITLAKGTISLRDGMPFDSRLVKISLADLKKGIPQKDISLHDSSTFEIELKPGDYQLFIKYPGYKTDTINLTVPLYFSGTLVAVNSALLPEKVFEGKFLSINNILFEFNSSILSNQAMSTLETLKSILISYPELKVEIAGYTDALGSTEYNSILSDKRAQAAIDYLVTSGASASRFVKKAYGKSNFVSLNTNRDGSDNPEGRKYNRRVTFGIIDPRTGIIIHQESYAPERLRSPYSLIYSIVLLKTTERVLPDYFSELVKDNLFFIRTFRSDTISMYSLGVFYNRIDALKYLDYARDKGFKDAYIVNQYELKNDSISLSGLEVRKSTSDQSGPREYTIQLKATKNQLDINKVFHGMEGVKERKSNDGFYRYYYGQYKTLSEAKKAVLSVIKMPGLEDAFITELSILLSQ